MVERLDYAEIERELERRLSLGPAGPAELRRALGISQPAFSRLIERNRARWLIVGQARATRYAARRSIAGAFEQVPIYELDEAGQARKLATLHATQPTDFYLEAEVDDVESAFYKDLPYFLNELRPAGFLGRLIPRRHPELELPSDILLWSADHCLKYLNRYGWNLSGNLIVGDEAFRLYLASSQALTGVVTDDERTHRYPELAADVLAAGPPGSSAGGEQPKFLAIRASGPTHVLVKFSPPVRDATSRRLADLLVAEHVALETLRAHGRAAAKSELLSAGERVFLEVERFDRISNQGRRGLISLLALDAEFVGRLQSWSDSALHLHAQHRIDDGALTAIRWLELFSLLIANTDVHAGNLSFFTRGTRLLGLAPAYDVLPMLYAPRQGHLEQPRFQLPVPRPTDTSLWSTAYEAASEVWSKLEAHPLLSAEFQGIARANLSELTRWRELAQRLPKP